MTRRLHPGSAAALPPRSIGGFLPRSIGALLPRSIRARMTTAATLVAAAVFLGASALTLATVPENLHGAVHTRVELAIRRVASDARTGTLPAELRTPARVQLLRALSQTGEVLASSTAFPQDARVDAFRPKRPESVETTELDLARHPEEPRSRHLLMAITVRSPRGPVTVQAASSLADVDRALMWIHLMVFVGTPLILVIVAVLTWAAVSFALRPVGRVRAELAEITGQDLSRRVSVPPTGDEIADLADTTNHTLDRLERSAETQRRFVADASHELRSPISALRAQLEVANDYPDETDWPATGARALAAADRLTGIIDELLMLAKLDAGAVTQRRVVDLCRVAEEQISRRAGGRVPIHLHACASAPVFGSPVQLDRLLTNLLDNAARHAASRIDVGVTVRGDSVVVTVTDDGDGIAPEDRERVFERFTRLESARAKDKGGSGLGLPLSREIATAHGGSLMVADHGPGARFVAVLPLHRG
ncbi:sensor histidine kinase [Nonomuraea gerenzanensis]|uniref:histidine kinase n=1 Tax=Nonomuraea gerenzanensis TaxID=93944 RepID=A0A1M4DYY3_9ACTN|nr:HAMP domain-containing sensor histidine kinase [Nonomuraea gerenzanensis]UBU14082.1 HAMP domain-containing histidine kinase [Nonomuraea gerenzanensis]SBO91773.1 probable two-component sensor kinase [Nonomuraea gerenzanensis]